MDNQQEQVLDSSREQKQEKGSSYITKTLQNNSQKTILVGF